VPHVQPGFWPFLGANVLLDLIGFTLYVSALEAGELGITYPLLALTPVFVIPVEWLTLGQHPGPAGAAGILLVAAGVYLLVSPGPDGGLLAPFRALAQRPGARRMAGVALIWSISGTFDRVAVLRSSPAFYGTMLSACLAIGFLPFALRRSRGGRPTGLPGAVRADPGGLALQGFLFAGMFVCQAEALRLTLAAYVLALKRSGTLLTVLAGALFFGEKGTRRRLAATLILLAGVVLVSR
jgi:drug/metabolite transporter (DMT)-like permease